MIHLIATSDSKIIKQYRACGQRILATLLLSAIKLSQYLYLTLEGWYWVEDFIPGLSDGVVIALPERVVTGESVVEGVQSSLVLDAMMPQLEAGDVEIDWADPDHDGRYQIVVVDQSAIGTSPSSNPATYTKAFGPIRELFASTPLAKPARSSANTTKKISKSTARSRMI